MIPENEKTTKTRNIDARDVTGPNQKIRSTKREIDNRRNKVYHLNLQGYSNEEIAKELQVSLSTIEKDLHSIHLHCLKWTQDIIAINAKKPMFDSYTRIEIAQKELWALYRNEKDTKVKRQILNSIVTNSIKQDRLTHGRYMTKYDDQNLRDLEMSLDEEAKSQLEK
jgi:FixJ family two-component response regulator